MVTDADTDVRALQDQDGEVKLQRDTWGSVHESPSMSTISRIGFVVDPAASKSWNVLAGCLVLFRDGGQSYWRAYPAGDTTYFRRLFVVAEFAARVFRGEEQDAGTSPEANPTTRILFPHEDPRYGFLVSYFGGVESRLPSDTRYVTIPPGMRKAVASLLKVHGQKKWLGIPISWTKDQFFFWTIEKYGKQVGEALPPNTDGEAVSLATQAGNYPRSVVSSEELTALAEKMRAVAGPRTYPWQQIYRHALRGIACDLTDPKWIQLRMEACEGGRESETAEKQSGTPISAPFDRQGQLRRGIELPNLLSRARLILLTGSPGAGKSTSLELLCSSCLRPNRGKAKRRPLPFLVDLKLDARVARPGAAPQADPITPEILSWSVHRILRRTCSAEALSQCSCVRRSLASESAHHAPSKAQMLETIRQTAEQWFRDQARRDEGIVLLVDGLENLDGGFKGNAYQRVSRSLPEGKGRYQLPVLLHG